MRVSTGADALLEKAARVSSLIRYHHGVRYGRAYDYHHEIFQPDFRRFLFLLQTKAGDFDFVGQMAKGHTLLVGEGNLSFSRSLLRERRIRPQLLTATTREPGVELSDEAKHNARQLRSAGAGVMHGIDARNLGAVFGAKRFDSIVFMFPNVASRKPIRGRNPNFVLVRGFLTSSSSQLEHDGRVMITAVNTPHYLGAFNFREAAKKAGFQRPDVYPFDPSSFSGYEHTMAHQDESALDNYDRFSLWVFRSK